MSPSFTFAVATIKAKAPTVKSAPPRQQRLLPVLRDLELDMVGTATLNSATVDARLINANIAITRDLTIDGANILSLTVLDDAYDILRSELLEQQVQLDLGVNGRWIYRRGRDIGAISVQGTQTTVKLWDAASAALRAQTKYLARGSSKTNLKGWATLLAREPEVRELVPGLRVIVPDPGAVPPAEMTSEPGEAKASRSAGPGFGEASIKVKRAPATARQQQVISGVLAECQKLGASRMVMVAAVMCITQESVAGAQIGVTGNDDVGIYQQGRPWISVAGAKDPAASTRAFLISGPTSWKRVHGSVRHAPGNLEDALKRVQGSVGGYAQWQAEATRTVDAWAGGSAGRAPGANPTSRSASRAVARPSTWRRGTARTPESSWTCLERYSKTLGTRRFIALPYSRNPRLVIAADQTLILAQPHLTINGLDDAMILSEPSVQLEGIKRAQTIDLDVSASSWSAPPGAVVRLRESGPLSLPWLVQRITSTAGDPIARVTLQQPSTRVEASATSSTAATAAGASSGRASSANSPRDLKGSAAVYAASVAIGRDELPYAWGGGHARAGVPSKGTNRKGGGPVVLGYDCSGAVVAALAEAGLGFTKGSTKTADSGTLVSWGQPGRGKNFTVWANAQHVFVEFHDMGAYKQFNTSPRRSALGGARVWTNTPSTAGLTPRHWPGC